MKITNANKEQVFKQIAKQAVIATKKQRSLNHTRTRWEKMQGDLKSAGLWEEYCEGNDSAVDHNFQDLLC